ncbi:MAG: exchange transporter [Chlamydiales bacterium]|jgi:AAA family ATP:ADP antiporter|nr:exchange transporter [Chlamydiales bacterium]
MNEKCYQREFSPLRAALWPIHNYELKKFLPMALIMFCILFNYTLLRDTKDTLVINSAGASTISFLKLYCVTPSAILFVLIYAKLANIFSREHIFYVILSPFLIFFGLFAVVIYPNLSTLHPSLETVQYLYSVFPRFKGLIDIFAYWSYSLFYVLSEIWGSAMIGFLFWQFANHITRINESKRFYGLFLVIGNISLILSGQILKFCSVGLEAYFPYAQDLWQISLYFLMGCVVLMGVVCMVIYRWMHLYVLTDSQYYVNQEDNQNFKKKKTKLSLLDSAKLIIHSRELAYITILMLAYGITINLVEVQWKNQLGLYFKGDKGALNAFLGNYSSMTGIAVILCGWLLSANILRRFSWFTCAIITPIVILIGGSTFFALITMYNNNTSVLSYFNIHPVEAAVFIGAGIVILSKAIKYSLFDTTKEIAYIPLDEEIKTKGKAAVDVIGGRFGKAGGAFIISNLGIFMATTDLLVIAPICYVLFAVITCCWCGAVKLLSKKVDQSYSSVKVPTI